MRLRVLMSPRWLARHALLVGWGVACVELGRWQWSRSQQPSGTAQNFFYALQWWFFVAVGIAVWVKLVREEARPSVRAAESSRPVREVLLPTAAAEDSAQFEEPAEDDEELASYNRYLAHLAAHPRR